MVGNLYSREFDPMRNGALMIIAYLIIIISFSSLACRSSPC